MIQIMTNACSEKDTNLLLADDLPEFTEVNHSIHHLCDTEAMSKVVKRIVSVVFLDAELKT